MFRFSIRKNGHYKWISKRESKPENLPADASLGAAFYHHTDFVRLEQEKGGEVILKEEIEKVDIDFVECEEEKFFPNLSGLRNKNFRVFVRERNGYWDLIGESTQRDEAQEVKKCLEDWRNQLSGQEQRIRETRIITE